jgi:geranylgeranyl diphosphate synthase type I
MQLGTYFSTMLPAIETELRRAVNQPLESCESEIVSMMAYHLGWEGEGAGPSAIGKRLRPFMVCLSTEAAGGEWKLALPAAAAVELLHNFSLIHDDIEDNGTMRRGRVALWVKWGMQQGINAGDIMFTLARMAMLPVAELVSESVAINAMRLFDETCIDLTRGQYLDISFEKRKQVSLDEYLTMVSGKTAALLACCTKLGAIVAQASNEDISAFGNFGQKLGLAFQMQDDLLGIWGDPKLTGKSVASDLISEKKTLPILYAIEQKGAFAKRWEMGNIQPEEAGELACLLEDEGAKAYTEKYAKKYFDEAVRSLEGDDSPNTAKKAMIELAYQLIGREK